MEIIWTEEALGDVERIVAYIARDNVSAGRELAALIASIVELLPTQSAKRRPGRVAGTRELVIPHTQLIIPYRVKHSEITVLRAFACTTALGSGRRSSDMVVAIRRR
jgi:toxin ParE1/3/4